MHQQPMAPPALLRLALALALAAPAAATSRQGQLQPTERSPAHDGESSYSLTAPPATNPGQLAAAYGLVGLLFTDAQLELALPEVQQRLLAYEALRARELANSVLPSAIFSPFVPGVERRALRPAAIAEGASLAPPATAVASREALRRPARLDDLAFWPIADLAELVRTRQVSCVELTEFYLARLARLDPHLHCVISFTAERALAQAADRDAELDAGRYRGPLHGIPWGVKDLFSVAGTRTTWGAKPFEDQVLDETATVVQRLDEAGAILIAKLSLGSLAMGDVWFGGRTRSPWDPRRGSSGSSAGSASATAAGGVAFAIGTETLGSLVSPSVACATTSLRPTFGRVSRHGAMALSWTMDKVGPITRTVADAALVFAALEGHDPHDPFSRDRRSLPAGQVAEGADAPARRRIGIVAEAFARSGGLRSVVDELMALGHTVHEVALPEFPVRELLITLSAEAATAFDELTRSGRVDLLAGQTRDAWPNTFRVARLIPAVEYLRAQRLRTQLMQELHVALADIDVLVHAPFAAGILQMTNLTGHPTITAPFVGATGPRSDGSPRSVCFTGQLDGDELLLALVADWQRAFPEHVLHPPLEFLDDEPPPDAEADRGAEGGQR